MINITPLEKQMIEMIIQDYEKCGVENTEFHNTYGCDAEKNKLLRGAFTSLKKKKIISHYNDPGCFNPIFPTEKFIEVCNENEIEINSKTMNEIRRYL